MRIFLRRWLRRAVIAGGLITAVAVLTMAGSALWLRAGASGHTFTEAAAPAAPVALVLGAQVYPDGIYRDPWFNSAVRERGAAVKALIDVVSHRDPAFLGPHEPGVEEALRG